MRIGARLGFQLPESDLRNDIFVPRYYDPEIDDRLSELARTHELVTIQELIDAGELQLTQGNYVGKMHYGTGLVPYIRTSDIANWELRGSPKHGVSELVYAQYVKRQDVQEMDVLLVHEGTYLIGTPCLLTGFDAKILFQHHLAKLRALTGKRITGPLLIATLLAPIVQRQIRAKQFTADIIDSIVGRLPEVALPLPRASEAREAFSERARAIFEGRAVARVRLAGLMRTIDSALLTGTADVFAEGESDPDATGLVSFLGERIAFQAFLRAERDILADVLVPRYYDPTTDADIRALGRSCELVTIGDLARAGRLDLETGDEVGKLAYGSGTIPFVRTSDLGNWELKHDPKQLVSDAVYDEYAARQSARANDILVVRDGTYLVGTSSMVAEEDLPLLFSGGIYRLRVLDPELDPYLVLALLNARVVKRQMRNKQFTRDVIDTLGRRLEEVVLPIPRDAELAQAIGSTVHRLLRARIELRERAKMLGADLEADITSGDETRLAAVAST
jgi:hypothetical protein